MAMLSQCGADLIIYDVFIAEMDGIEMIQLLKSIYPAVKILAISGGGGAWRNGLDILEVGKMLGATETLAKPFEMSQVLTAARRLLALKGAGVEYLN